MNPNVEKGLVGAAVLAGLVLLLPVAKQSKEFVNCVKNAETGIINLAGVEFTDVEGKGGFIERPVAVHYSTANCWNIQLVMASFVRSGAGAGESGALLMWLSLIHI